MAKKIAVINMKGGVGKSTLSVNLAWHFYSLNQWAKRVLLVDLDPQFNASQYMLGVHRYQQEVHVLQSPTIWDVFEQATRAPGMRSSGRKLTDCIKRVRSSGSRYLDLIPSQLELSFTLKNPSGKEHLLSNLVADVEADYDFIVVDCAPTESVLTTAAYLTCDELLVPVKPEFLCTIGLPLIKQSMDDFNRLYKKQLGMAGIAFNACSGYSPEESTAKSEVHTLAQKFGWHVFSEEIPFSRSFPSGARQGQPIFRTSYSRYAVCEDVAGFCNSFAATIGL